MTTTAEPRAVTDLRERIKNRILGASTLSVEVMFDLALVKSEAAWRSWRRPDGTTFEYFGDWCDHDFGEHYSRSYLSQLAECGVTFWPYKDKINERVKKGGIGIRRLRELHLRSVNGTSMDDVMASVESGKPLACEDGPQGKNSSPLSDPEHLVAMNDVALVKSGDQKKAMVGLTLACIRGGYSRYFDAFQDWVISEAENTELPASVYEKWRELIMTGKFVCRRCGLVPIPPDEHHVIPRSMGGTDGPTVVLCSDCHLTHVQPNWRKYADTWLGGKRVNELLQEYKTSGRVESGV